MQYICLFCEALGASGDKHGPATYNCHVCGQLDGMWPKELAQKHLHVVATLQRQSPESVDKLVVAELQRDLNTAKKRLRDMQESHKYQSERRDTTIALGLKIIDQVLPQIGGISVDVGAINEFCMRARPRL